MGTNLERYRADLKRLRDEAKEMNKELEVLALERGTPSRDVAKKIEEAKAKFAGAFGNPYQRWFTEACSVLAQLIPARLDEFRSLYGNDPKRKAINNLTYTIQDWLLGLRSTDDAFGQKHFDDLTIVSMKFSLQRQLLEAAEARFESALFDLRNIVRADLFDSELSAARDLKKHGFVRAAGVIAGVVLEEHLGQVCNNHQIRVTKKNPTIADYNDLLRDGGVYDIPVWRNIQRLADLRNLSGHKKEREPTDEEVGELIDGVDKTMKTIL